ncbi:hypothetical protein PROFUN_07235 [Planoprotostelium fungivorum]|uniref:Uncharacterized protein n=1 Tax=Planoprotostelium fungivorum TaxID=1890364 RepID=A0A2P6NM58_9EUKA|nr:hypothetical protein PROFUN_07235 [Planoprotostelium fungivorum]
MALIVECPTWKVLDTLGSLSGLQCCDAEQSSYKGIERSRANIIRYGRPVYGR